MVRLDSGTIPEAFLVPYSAIGGADFQSSGLRGGIILQPPLMQHCQKTFLALPAQEGCRPWNLTQSDKW